MWGFKECLRNWASNLTNPNLSGTHRSAAVPVFFIAENIFQLCIYIKKKK